MRRSELRKGGPRHARIRWGNIWRCRRWDLVKRSLSPHVYRGRKERTEWAMSLRMDGNHERLRETAGSCHRSPDPLH